MTVFTPTSLEFQLNFMLVELANFSCTHQTQTLYSFPVLIEIFILFFYFSKKKFIFFKIFNFFMSSSQNLILSPTTTLFTTTYYSTSPSGSELQQLGSAYITNVSKPLHIISTQFGWQQLLSLKPRDLSKFNAKKVMGFIVLMCKALF